MEPLEARTVARLPLTMQMIYWTGAVARNDVILEHALAGICARLLGLDNLPDGVHRLLTAIRNSVRAGGIKSAALADLSLGLLDDIEQAHATRNRLVHDLWWGSASDDDTLFGRLSLRTRPSRGPSTRDLSEFRACAEQLALCEFRTVALSALLDDEGADPSERDDLSSWWAILAGDVELTEGGGYRVIHDDES